MSFICVICRDELVHRTGRGFGTSLNSSFDWTDCEDSDDDENSEDTSILTTSCGHLFHKSCLSNWFKVECEAGAPWKSCPYCKKVLNALGVNSDSIEQRGFHRVFPVCAEIYEDQEPFPLRGQCQPEKSIETLDEAESEIENLKAINLIQMKTNQLLEVELLKMRENNKSKSVALDELETQVTGLSDILQSLEIENKALRTLRNKLVKNMETKLQGKGDQNNHHQKLQQKETQAAAILTTTMTEHLNSSNRENDTGEPAPALEINISETSPSFPPPMLPPKLLPSQTSRAPLQKSHDLKLGDRVLYRSTSIFAGPLPYSGIVKSLYLNRFGRKIAGVEFDQKIPHGMSGLFFIRQYFDCRPKHGRLIENSRLTKIEQFQLRLPRPSLITSGYFPNANGILPQ